MSYKYFTVFESLLGWFECDDLFIPTDANLYEFIPLGEYKLYSEMISTKFESDDINGRLESKHLDISIF